MKKALLLLGIINSLYLSSCSTQKSSFKAPLINQEAFSGQNQPMLIGPCSKSALLQEPYRVWYETNYNAYQVDTTLLKNLKVNPLTDTFLIFMATWCGDSQVEVPKFFKILRYLNIPQANYKIIMVDNSAERYKQSPNHEEIGNNIFKVPTFIIQRNGQEIGRIIEHPSESFEKDLTHIINDGNYTPIYSLQPKVYDFIENRENKRQINNLKKFVENYKSQAKNVSELNAYGYVLLGQKRFKEAIMVFQINTFLFPENDNAYDSLGEAYMMAGKKELAILNYEKAVKLNPKADSSRKVLERLKG